MVIISLLVVLLIVRGVQNYLKVKSHSIKMLHVTLLSSLMALFIGLYGAEGLIYNPEACFFWFFSGVLMKLPELEKASSLHKTAGT